MWVLGLGGFLSREPSSLFFFTPLRANGSQEPSPTRSSIIGASQKVGWDGPNLKEPKARRPGGRKTQDPTGPRGEGEGKKYFKNPLCMYILLF